MSVMRPFRFIPPAEQKFMFDGRHSPNHALQRHQYTCLTVGGVYLPTTGRQKTHLVFAFAAGVGVFATRFTSAAKRLWAALPFRASRASRASVCSRVSVAFIFFV